MDPIADARATLARLCTDGVVLAGRQDKTDPIRERGRLLLAAGPPPPTTTELDLARYGLTDLLDDLAGSTDAAETAVIGWHVWFAVAELALLTGGHWPGSGKWLLRELCATDAALADRLVSAISHPDRLTEIADDVLGRAGGRLWAGLRLPG
jgi:hypothetical protein